MQVEVVVEPVEMIYRNHHLEKSEKHIIDN
jgi:hypothetical protein